MQQKFIKIGRTNVANPAYKKTLADFASEYGSDNEAQIMYDEYMNDEQENFEGNINEYEFNRRQAINFAQIQDILRKYNKCLTYIHAGVAKLTKNRKTQISYADKFIAYNDDKSIYWYKYEGKTIGGGHNYVYVNGKQCKTTYFIINWHTLL